ncbi:MAG: sigma 54-interacting transcriptional regulator [Candidatus Marinimicrobia bacterium]|nr:sigma 54-interacting transcriptional regulator [Candidatus Neomarinimicrobiota bacterium]
MNKSEFFRQATLRICGNLDIEAALYSLLIFLQDHMPVTNIFLQKFEPGFNSMRTIAYANSNDCGSLDLLTPLTSQSQERAGSSQSGDGMFLIDDPGNFPVAQEMLSFHNLHASSLLLMIMRAEILTLGSLVLISEEPDRFNDEHKELMALLTKPLIVALSNVLKHREILSLKDLLAEDNRFLQKELRSQLSDEIIGANFGLKNVMSRARQVAGMDSPVLLLGETGVGKDVIAQAIHYSSKRRDRHFIKVNCGAIPESLIDSELFGHEKGAFTGALKLQLGKFERADGGTIFLDEIGELPLKSQTRLLQVLQEKTIERVGGTETLDLDIRIIAATNRNLEAMVSSQEFRADLWFRLNVFPINIPPLRDRLIDLPAFTQYFLHEKSKELKLEAVPELKPGAITKLSSYEWPGNVRELQNIIEREIIINPSGPIDFSNSGIGQTIKSKQKVTHEGTIEKLDLAIARHIQRALTATGGVIHGPSGAAELLGVNPNTLRSRIKKLSSMFDFRFDG